MSRPQQKAPLPAVLLSHTTMIRSRPLFVQMRYGTRRCNDPELANEIADALCQLDGKEFENAWPRGLAFTKDSLILRDAIVVRVADGKFQHLIDRGFEDRFNELCLQWAGAKPLDVFRW